MIKKSVLKNFWPTYMAAGCAGIYFAYGLLMFFPPFDEWSALRRTGWALQLCLFIGWAWVMYGYTRSRLRHDQQADHYVTKIQEAEAAKAEAERARERYARYCKNIAIQLESQRSRPMYEVRRAPIQAEVFSPPPEPPELR